MVIGNIDLRDKIKQNLPVICLVVMILVLSFYMIYWGTQKGGFHVDEMYTFMQIKGDGQTRIFRQHTFYNVWHDAADMEAFITIAPEDAFSFARVTRNGSHPPLYFYLLHIVYSFFPGVFTIWPHIFFNLAFYIGTIIALYCLSKLLISDKYLALLPPLLWGISSAAIEFLVFMRMYMMMTFACVLFMYFAYAAITKEERSWKLLIAVTLSAYFGMMTQYYFLIIAFFISAFACLYMLLRKDIRRLFEYVAAMGVSLLLFELIGPRTFMFVLRTGRGREARANLLNDNISMAERLERYVGIISTSVFTGANMIIVLVLLVVAIGVTFFIVRKKGIDVKSLLKSKEVALWLMTLGVCLSYALILSRIAPYGSFRYIGPIMPFIMLLFVSPIVYLINLLVKKTYITFLIVSVTCSVLLIANTSVNFLYRIDAENRELLKPYVHVPMVYVSEYNPAALYWYFLDFEDQVLVTALSGFGEEAFTEKDYENGMIIFLNTRDANENMDWYLSLSGLSDAEWLFNIRGQSVYYLS